MQLLLPEATGYSGPVAEFRQSYVNDGFAFAAIHWRVRGKPTSRSADLRTRGGYTNKYGQGDENSSWPMLRARLEVRESGLPLHAPYGSCRDLRQPYTTTNTIDAITSANPYVASNGSVNPDCRLL